MNVKRWLGTLPPWTLTLLGLVLLLWLTLAPHPLGEEELPLFPGADKIAHLIMFGGFTLLMLLDMTRRNSWSRISLGRVLTACGFASVLGILVEIAQWKMEMGRSFETVDIIADAVGSVLCIVIWLVFAPRIIYSHH